MQTRIKTLVIASFTIFIGCKEHNNVEELLNDYDKFIAPTGKFDIFDYAKEDTLIFLDRYSLPENDINYIKDQGIGSFVESYMLISPIRGINKIIYLIDGDIELSPEKLNSLVIPNQIYSYSSPENISKLTSSEIESVQEDLQEYMDQYRTFNVVKGLPVINVVGVNITNNDLKSAILNSLQTYNNLELEFNFELSGWYDIKSGMTNEQFIRWKEDNNINIVITETSGTGGRAGFPKNNGMPHDYITIGRDIAPSYGLPVAQHVVTHEIGHCIGLRHTDYFNRSISCGKGGNEHDNDRSKKLGAELIPGTPAYADLNSVMLACYNSTNIGQLSDYDIIALEEIYGN